MQNYIDEILKEFDHNVNDHYGNRYEGDARFFAGFVNKTRIFIKQKLQDLEKIYSSARKTYLLGYEDGQNKKVEEIRKEIVDIKAEFGEFEDTFKDKILNLKSLTNKE